MNSLNYNIILKHVKSLSTATKNKLVLDTLKLLDKSSTTTKTSYIECPFCAGKHIVKNGKNKTTQRYLCVSCKKSFIEATNTPIYNSKKDISLWLKFFDCLKMQYSIRKTAKHLNIAPSTAFFWRHKILDAIREHYKFPELKDEIQCDQTFFKESFKGNHSFDGFYMPRKPIYKRNIHPYEEFSRERVCVITALDSNNTLFLAPITIGKPSSSDLIRSIGKNIKERSIFIAKKSYCFKTMSSFCKLKYFEIPLCGARVNGHDISKIQDVNLKLKSFFKPYNGVATKYLGNYLSLFRYVFMKYNDFNPIFMKGDRPYLNTNFKGRTPIFI